MTPAGSTEPPTRCRRCGRRLEPGAVVCLGCGHNWRTGVRAKTFVHATTTSNAPRAMIISSLATVVGGVAWGLLLAHVSTTFGFLAMALGLVAGGGMLLLTKERSTRVELAAVGATIVAIVIGKLFTLSNVAASDVILEFIGSEEQMIKVVASDMHTKKEIDAELAEIMQDDEATIETADMVAKVKALRAQIKKRLDAMTVAEKRALARLYADKVFSEIPTGGGFGVHLSLWDSLWFFLAVGLAFLLARGRGHAPPVAARRRV